MRLSCVTGSSQCRALSRSYNFPLFQSALALHPAYNAILKRGATLAAWQRLAVWLSCLALLSLLLAPAASLAQDLQTGKLGSICSASKSTGTPPTVQDGDQDATPYHAHCPVCSVAWGLPMAGAAWTPTRALQSLALAVVAADPAAPVIGLPFSRGPPAL